MKTKNLVIRVSEEEKKVIEEIANEFGYTISKLLKEGLYTFVWEQYEDEKRAKELTRKISL